MESTLQEIESLGDNHVGTSMQTPMRADAFDLSDQEKIEKIQDHFHAIMETLGLDITDESLSGTPYRVAKMYVKELFGGLNPKNKPDMTVFDNKYKYGEMLVEKNITMYSSCEHHFLPIVGKAHVAYMSTGKVVGLSKINRLVNYYANRPQVQERLTLQIANDLKEALQTEDVAVIIDGVHLCVSSRGVRDVNSTTITAEYGGRFKEETVRKEFLTYINLPFEK